MINNFTHALTKEGVSILDDWHDRQCNIVQEKLNDIDKIHNLKRKNKQLSDKRYQHYKNLRSFDTCAYGYLQETLEIMRLSEIMGGNGIKIQQLRAKIKTSEN